MKLLDCVHCGFSPVVEEGITPDEYRVECTNPDGCRAWIKIYSRFKKYAIEAWNKANAKSEESEKFDTK